MPSPPPSRYRTPVSLSTCPQPSLNKQILAGIHQPGGQECLPLGINRLKNAFNKRFTINSYQKVITDKLRACTGSCKLIKRLKTAQPPPQPVRSNAVMDRMQIGLIEMYGPKSPLCLQANHNYRLVLSVIDCFSTYCWLVPLCSKTAVDVAKDLCFIFLPFGCPNIIHSDNGKEFVANVVHTHM